MTPLLQAQNDICADQSEGIDPLSEFEDEEQ